VVLAAHVLGWTPQQTLAESLGRLYRILEPRFPLGPEEFAGGSSDEPGPRSPVISYVWTDPPKVR